MLASQPPLERNTSEWLVGSPTFQALSVYDLQDLAERFSARGFQARDDPYLYSAPEKCLFSCSQDISGTRKQESKNGAYPAETKTEILVPAAVAKSRESAGSCEQEFWQPEQAEIEP
jgi:hypothetical protein